MPLPKTVTAQDFICAVDLIDDGYNGCEVADWTSVEFDALLSRARQEAIEECDKKYCERLKELVDGGWITRDAILLAIGMDVNRI